MLTQPRRFVDFQSQSVAGAVEESFHPPVAPAGLVTLLRKILLHRAHARPSSERPAPQLFEADLLSAKHRVVQPPHPFARAPAHDGAGDVAEITGPLRAGKNINDDRLIRAQRTEAALVRVTALLAARDDGVGRPARTPAGSRNQSPRAVSPK